MRKRLSFIVAFAFCLLLAFNAYPKNCILRVTAKDKSTGKQIYDFSAQLTKKNGKETNLGKHSAYRWSEGTVYWRNLPCGNFLLKIKARGYKSLELPVILGEEKEPQTKQLEVELEKK